MKKILILGFTKIAYMPYINFYLESIESQQVEIHVISWNRDGKEDVAICSKNVKIHEFNCEQLDEVPKIKKIGSFIKYRNFAKKVIRKEKIDKIIVLHTLPGVLLTDILLRKYKSEFVLDYRDYTYEDLIWFKNIVGKLVMASYATFVSSNAFRSVLPQVKKIYTSHNLLMDSLDYRDVRSALPRNHCPIRIAFWGFIRHEKINHQLIEILGNDNRFELHYYGREQQTATNLKALVKKRSFKNVFFHGIYEPTERYEFAAKTDLIHNLYENDPGTKRAMGNKYYDGIIFRIPQLCTKNSFMCDQMISDGVGYEVDLRESNLGDRIKNYYDSLNWPKFEESCDSAVKKIVGEYNAGKAVIQKFCNGEKYEQVD